MKEPYCFRQTGKERRMTSGETKEVRMHAQIVGKSGFVSHTKHIAEATNINLFHL